MGRFRGRAAVPLVLVAACGDGALAPSGAERDGRPASPVRIDIAWPADASTVASPVGFSASAYSTAGAIAAMKLYVDSALVFSVSDNHLDTSEEMAPGPHSIHVDAWDTTGNVSSKPLRIMVLSASTSDAGGSDAGTPASDAAPGGPDADGSDAGTVGGGFDSYPATANVHTHLENASWVSCNCGGTGTQPSSESLTNSGGSTTVTITGSGSGVSGWLWYTSFASVDAVNWIMDYDVTPLTNPLDAAALEFDGNQTGALGNFVFGTECNYGFNPSQKTVWRFWTRNGGETWATTTRACPITQANHTYHVQMHFVVSNGQYRVAHVMVTDRNTGTLVEDETDLGTFNSVGSNTGHGNSIDIQPDVPRANQLTARYENVTIVRW
jgi:hypothetical protein